MIEIFMLPKKWISGSEFNSRRGFLHGGLMFGENYFHGGLVSDLYIIFLYTSNFMFFFLHFLSLYYRKYLHGS